MNVRFALQIAGLCLALPFGFASALQAGQWLAATETGCQVWIAEPQGAEEISWTGSCTDGKVEGDGVLQRKLGDEVYSRFAGMMVAGRREGEGQIVYSNGIRYDGQFQNDQFHGKGVWSTLKGER